MLPPAKELTIPFLYGTYLNLCLYILGVVIRFTSVYTFQTINSTREQRPYLVYKHLTEYVFEYSLTEQLNKRTKSNLNSYITFTKINITNKV
jgi:hypothetical protein